MKNNRPENNEIKFEKMLSYLLIIGVIISMILEIIGVVLLYRSSGNLNISREAGVYIKGHDFFSFIYQQIKNPQSSTALKFLTGGIIVLILTPYLRVLTSVVHFSWQKNLRYVLITLFVLIALTISLILH